MVGCTCFASSPTERLESYTSALMRTAGHSDANEPFHHHFDGLQQPGDWKGVDPMAARLENGDIRPVRQRMHRLVVNSPWSDQRLRPAVGD